MPGTQLHDDDVSRLRWLCPDDGETGVEIACPGGGGWRATCAIHDDLGGASNTADCMDILRQHYEGQRATGTPRA